MKKMKKINIKSLSSLPIISENFLKELVKNNSDLINIPNTYSPIIEFQKRKKSRKIDGLKRSESNNLYLDDCNKHYPNLQLNSSKVNLKDLKDLDTDYKINKKKFKTHKCKSKSLAIEIERNTNLKNDGFNIQSKAKYLKLMFEEDNTINKDIHQKLIILRKYVTYTFDTLQQNFIRKQQINQEIPEFNPVENDDLPYNYKNKEKYDYNPLKVFFDSIKKMKNLNLTEKTIFYKKEKIIDIFLDAMLEKITRKVYYINDKNLEITRERVVNLMQDEIYSISKNFEGIIQYPVFIKHFSTDNDKKSILPIMSDLQNKNKELELVKKEVYSQSLEPIRESRESSRSMMSHFNYLTNKKLKFISSNDFFSKLNSKNKETLLMINDSQKRKNNSLSNFFLGDIYSTVNLIKNSNSNSNSNIHLEETKINSNTNRNTSRNPIKKTRTYTDVEESHEVDFLIIRKDTDKMSTIQKIINSSEDEENNSKLTENSYIEGNETNTIDSKSKSRNHKGKSNIKKSSHTIKNITVDKNKIERKNTHMTDKKNESEVVNEIEEDSRKDVEIKKKNPNDTKIKNKPESDEVSIDVKKLEEKTTKLIDPIKKANEEKKKLEEKKKYEEQLKINKEKEEKKRELAKKKIEDKKFLEKKLKDYEIKKQMNEKMKKNEEKKKKEISKEKSSDSKSKDTKEIKENKEIKDNKENKDTKNQLVIPLIKIEKETGNLYITLRN